MSGPTSNTTCIAPSFVGKHLSYEQPVRSTILYNVPLAVSPELLYVLAQMGHGDEIVLADANFPAHSTCENGTLIYCAHVILLLFLI